MTTILIDADIVAYRCAASCEKQGVVTEPYEVALDRIDDLMQRIMYACQASSYEAFLTGSNNFRYDIYPDYKGNRKDVRRPEYLQECREHLVTGWNATVSDGNEADDEMGLRQTGDTIICSIDKDLLMIPGRHYNFVKDEHQEVSQTLGLQNFYWQLIMGDKSDNILGYDGKMRTTVPKFLQELQNALFSFTEERDMYELVLSVYQDPDLLPVMAKCLWIQQKDRIEWEPPKN